MGSPVATTFWKKANDRSVKEQWIFGKGVVWSSPINLTVKATNSWCIPLKQKCKSKQT